MTVDTKQTKTIAANLAAEREKKKKVNPYLAHTVETSEVNSSDSVPLDQFDERLPEKSHRHKHKSLQFVEAGKYIEEEKMINAKEEGKLMAGYASGRKQLNRSEVGLGGTTTQAETKEEGREELEGPGTDIDASIDIDIPNPSDHGVSVVLEWWDEAFLDKNLREKCKTIDGSKSTSMFQKGSMSWNASSSSSATAAGATASSWLGVKRESGYGWELYDSLDLANNKFYKYIQHPVPVKAIGYVSATAETQQLPMYLTKKERKKIRKAKRAEAEQEKRDKIMMGLIPQPEAKLKMSNFMKVLGDQAIADPSKVEMKVLQQMQKRVIDHEMRNLAKKLTPKQRKEKKMRKLLEDTSKSVSVAVFSVKDFNSLKHRFQVDVNAQQFFLSGLALLCPEEKMNMIVVEGGPKGIKKFIRLMTMRIKWCDASGDKSLKVEVEESEQEMHLEMDAKMDKDSDNDGDSSDNDSGDEELSDGDNNVETDIDAANLNNYRMNGDTTDMPQKDNRCDLLWQGIIPRRQFTGFKFQECNSSAAAKNMLDSKNTGHYWDMVMKADDIVAASASLL